jgi:hypothetical protein
MPRTLALSRRGWTSSVEKAGKHKRVTFTVSENDGVLFNAPSIDDVDYFLKLRTGKW